MRGMLRLSALLGCLLVTAIAQADGPDFNKVVEGAKVQEGLFKTYLKKDSLLVELPPNAFGKEYLFLLSLSRGIGEGGLLGGMSLYFGDDWIMSFRKLDERVQLIRKNVRYRAASGSPPERAVKNSFTDSVVAALPIVATAPNGAVLVDFSQICLTDFAGLGPELGMAIGGAYGFDRGRSSYNEIKVFPKNLEIDVEAVYGSGQVRETDTVPDTRGVQLGVHYSVSELPQTSYKPRVADPRVGYFVTAVKDYTDTATETPFVRYLNRWNLEKADPMANPSPPKEPIIFYLENTIPYKWRPYVTEGILAWNKAFRKLGFADAVQVRDLPEGADPEDVRYNTFRWITTGAGFAMGPSRVNPRTGQILDADIIFDADMIRYWQMEFDDLIQTRADARAQWAAEADRRANPRTAFDRGLSQRAEGWCICQQCALGQGLREQMSVLAMAQLATAATEAKDLPDEVLGQAIREVTMHEVGHTLGLRHNFKASTWKSLDEINQTKPGEPSVASVMDYNAANIQPKGKPQGLYFPVTIGPWDEWVIEYGYSTVGEDAKKLAEIATKAPQPELAYATDEDTRSIDPDPLTNRFDLGNDPIAFSKQEVELARSLMPGIIDKVTKPGDSYNRGRRAFSVLLGMQLRSNYRVMRFVGGQFMARDHKGDPGAKPPFTIVPAAKQREALAFLKDNLFSDAAFQFPPEVLNMLAPSRWSHWGSNQPLRLEFPLHELILRQQSMVLGELLDPLILERISDNETRFPAGQEAFVMPELFRSLTDAIWSEVMPAVDPANPASKATKIASLRRALQREYVQRLINMRLRGGVPEDARALASMHLRELKDKIAARVDGAGDDYTRSHLVETQDRIARALDAQFQQASP